MKKVRVGILCQQNHKLDSYHIHTFQRLFDSEFLDVVVKVYDGRADFRRKHIPFWRIISKAIMKSQLLFERIIFSKSIRHENKSAVLKKLDQVPAISLNPITKGFRDYFTEDIVTPLLDFDIDVLLRYEFGIISGDILTLPKYGIWSFHHGDNDINRGGPAGFWEARNKEAYVGATLQKLSDSLDGGDIIDKMYYHVSPSYFLNNKEVRLASIEILIKNLRLLSMGRFQVESSKVYFNPLYRSPHIKDVLMYLLFFYGWLFDKVLKKLSSYFYNRGKWNLFIGDGKFENAVLYKCARIVPPKNEFWADPFLLKKDNATWVFFENYDYQLDRGKISCGKLINNAFCEIKDILTTDYHLSYPSLFEYANTLFMIPESNEARNLQIWRCIEFPLKWELEKTLFEGEIISDAQYFEDNQGSRWLFLNKREYQDVKTVEMWIYKIIGEGFDDLKSHVLNPVSYDCRNSRNAGPMYYNEEGELIRPSQDHSFGQYGSKLVLNKIVALTIDDYKHVELNRIEPNFISKLDGIHHLHQIEDRFVFDARFR